MSIGGTVSASLLGAAVVGVLAFGTVQVVNASQIEREPEVVQVADFGTETYDLSTVLDARAEKAERDRIAAEKAAAEKAAAEKAAAEEAARVAAEQAAADEAARTAAEEAASWEEPVTYDEPTLDTSGGIPAGAWPLTWIDDPNATDGGYWDFGACATSASTINGQPYCMP